MNFRQSLKLQARTNYIKLKSKLNNFQTTSKRQKLIKIFILASLGLTVSIFVNKPLRKYVRAIGFKIFHKVPPNSSNSVIQIKQEKSNCCVLVVLTSFALLYSVLRQMALMDIITSEIIIRNDESSFDDQPFALLIAIPIFTTMFRGMVPINNFLAYMLDLIWVPSTN